jgi:hypothetical protein
MTISSYDQPKAEELPKGFGVRHVQDGIRGTGSLIALNNSDKTNRLLTAKVSNHFGLKKCYFKPRRILVHYGMMALLRQVKS